MAGHRDQNVVRVARIDGDLRNLLAIAQAEVRPGLSRIRRFVNAVANGEVGPLKTFAACDVNDVRVGRRDGDGADGLRRLVVEDGRPGAAVVVRFPDAAVHLAHVKDIRLARHTRHGARSPAAMRANHAPAHALKHRVGILLGLAHADDRHQKDSGYHPLEARQTTHVRPPARICGAKNIPKRLCTQSFPRSR